MLPMPTMQSVLPSRVSLREVVEDLGLLEHREELLVLLGRAPPPLRPGVVPRPPRRRYEVLPVEHPQPPVYLPDAPEVLLLEVARNEHGSQSAPPFGRQASGIRSQAPG